MENVAMKRDKDRLIIEIDLSKDLGPSGSGKTRIVASTHGNKPVPESQDTLIGLNCFRYTSPKKGK